MTSELLKAPTKADRLYDLKEVAELLNVSVGEVRRLCADGEIATLKLARAASCQRSRSVACCIQTRIVCTTRTKSPN